MLKLYFNRKYIKNEIKNKNQVPTDSITNVLHSKRLCRENVSRYKFKVINKMFQNMKVNILFNRKETDENSDSDDSDSVFLMPCIEFVLFYII